jgi:hypothetical protein
MLTKIRIEVEEETAEACVEALWKYEHEIQTAEAKRYHDCWPVAGGVDESGEAWAEDNFPKNHPWSDGVVERSFFNGELGRELVEEVIEYDDGLPGYRARRVVKFIRVDMRSRAFLPLTAARGGASVGVMQGTGTHLAMLATRAPHAGEYVEPQPVSVTSD